MLLFIPTEPLLLFIKKISLAYTCNKKLFNNNSIK